MSVATLAQALRIARIRHGHTQVDAAHAMDVGLRTLKGWETGARPRIDAVPLLSEYLERTYDDVVRLALTAQEA